MTKIKTLVTLIWFVLCGVILAGCNDTSVVVTSNQSEQSSNQTSTSTKQSNTKGGNTSYNKEDDTWDYYDDDYNTDYDYGDYANYDDVYVGDYTSDGLLMHIESVVDDDEEGYLVVRSDDEDLELVFYGVITDDGTFGFTTDDEEDIDATFVGEFVDEEYDIMEVTVADSNLDDLPAGTTFTFTRE